MSLTKVKAGNILLTTPSASSNDVTPATTQYVTTALANMVDSAPSTLNTLNELAAALGDDANFSTTVTNSIAAKAPLASPTFTGTITGPHIVSTSNTATQFKNATDTDIEHRFETNSGADFALHRLIGSDGVDNKFIIGYGPNHGSTANHIAIKNNHASGSIGFNTSATSAERMRINSSGNVGIGTSSPSNLLHASGTGSTRLQIDATDNNAAGAGLYMKVLNSGSLVGNATLRVDNTGNLDIFTGTSSESQKMTILAGGNVGIGVTDPATNLHIGSGTAGENLGVKLNRGSTTNFFVACDGTKQAYIGVDNTQGFIKMGSLSNHPVSISQANANAIYIDTSKNVGIGTTGPGFLGLTGSGKVLHLSGTNTQLRLANSIIHHDNAGLTKLTIRNNYGATSASALMELQAGSIYFCTGTSFTERLRINHLGRQAYSGSASANGHGNFVGEVGSGYKALAFERTVGGGEVGSIVANTGSTSYYTTSDYRLKENVDYTWDATTRLKQLKPARFNFIADDTNTLVDGFLAHEVSSIVPEAIYGEKDGMADPILYADGDEIPEGKSVGDVKTASVPEYQQIDQSKLVPLLVKTIQELEARITTLEG